MGEREIKVRSTGREEGRKQEKTNGKREEHTGELQKRKDKNLFKIKKLA